MVMTSTVYSQNKSGIITYKGEVNQKYVDSFLTALKAKKDVAMHTKQGVVEMYHNATPEKFVLNFKDEESYYYNIPTLEDTGEGLKMGSNAGTIPFYTNNDTDTIVEMGQTLGFVAYNPLDWQITNKTKTIGGYQCYQAIATEKLFSRKGYYYNRKVVASFTPEIPLNFGPKYYKGLPGLILEIERDKFTLTATKLNLNPEDKDINIKRLDKNDKVITETEANNRIKEIEGDREKRYKR